MKLNVSAEFSDFCVENHRIRESLLYKGQYVFIQFDYYLDLKLLTGTYRYAYIDITDGTSTWVHSKSYIHAGILRATQKVANCKTLQNCKDKGEIVTYVSAPAQFEPQIARPFIGSPGTFTLPSHTELAIEA